MSRLIRKPVPKGLICLGFEDSKPKSWLIFQKCHYSSDIWPRLKLNRGQKVFSASGGIEPRPKGSLGFKNRESLFFLFFLACAFSLSATHLHYCCCTPTTHNYKTFGSFVFWFGEVRFGAREMGISSLCYRCVVDWCCAWMEICDLLQMVDFGLHLCKCDVHIFVYEEHGGCTIQKLLLR